MSKKPKPALAVATVRHPGQRRVNNATIEQQNLAPEDPVLVVFPRRFSPDKLPQLYEIDGGSDPKLTWMETEDGREAVQLMWRGKAEQDAGSLEIQAVPIYTAEKLHPKVIIDDIVRRSKTDRPEPNAPDLFADFNGLDLEDAYTFYDHSVTRKWSNRLILGDSLQVMASLAEKESLRSSVQCIYFDPPYGIRFNSNWQVSTRSRDVRDGKDRSHEPEQVKAFRDTWEDGVHSYLSYLRDRLVMMRDLLTESGSIFVQIGDENVHRVRAVMDEVFGAENGVSLITYMTTTGRASSDLATAANYLIWYAKNRDVLKFRAPLLPKSKGSSTEQVYRYARSHDGVSRSINPAKPDLRHEERIFRVDNIISSRSAGEGDLKSFEFQGKSFGSGKGTFKSDEAGLTRLAKAGRIWAASNSIQYIRMLDDFDAIPISNVWTDTQTGNFTEDKIYVVQTAEKVVERCILMTTDPGDLVLDPTCGSGTTAHVAEQWGRRWITIDTSRVALTLARTRLMGARYPWYALADSPEGAVEETRLRLGRRPTDAEAAEARRGTFTNDIAHGLVLNRVPHVTLKSIANNKGIDVIWDEWKPTLELLRAELNSAAGVDWNEWEIPRQPIYPWDEKAAKAHSKVRTLVAEAEGIAQDPDAEDADIAKLERKIGKAIVALGKLLGRPLSVDNLPEYPGDPLPEPAQAPHSAWWTARISRQREIDSSIKANAETQYLFDKPVELKNVVRVAGPFTVDSLSPHRVLPADEDDPLLSTALDEGAPPPHRLALRAMPTDDGDNFIRVVIDNLRVAGVGNTKRGERLRFIDIRPFAARYINAEGRYVEGESEGAPERRAAIFIGPEYDTVTRKMIVDAAKEASTLFDVLIVCGFAFEAHASQETMQIGTMSVLKVNMNQDLRMADRLKTSDQGNLFVVFGEPDVSLRRLAGGDYVAEIKGVDIFNPNTGELKPSVKVEDDVACWFIDDDYDGTSFFVRQAYFLGGKDPYEKLRIALKAEIDEEAWQVLNSTVSRPFEPPSTGEIAIKVINHYGDEVMKVYGIADD